MSNFPFIRMNPVNTFMGSSPPFLFSSGINNSFPMNGLLPFSQTTFPSGNPQITRQGPPVLNSLFLSAVKDLSKTITTKILDGLVNGIQGLQSNQGGFSQLINSNMVSNMNASRGILPQMPIKTESLK